MIGSNFDHIRNFLLDPSNEGMERRNITRAVYFGIKVGAGVCTVVTSVAAVSALVSVISYPILGTIGALWAVAAAVLGREVFVVAENIGNMLSENGATQNIFSRLGNSLTPARFVSSIFKNTWIAEPLLSSVWIEQLNRSKTA